METVVVLGQGYVGLPMALSAARAGFQVFGLDTNSELVEELRAGYTRIGDVSPDDLAAVLNATYNPTDDPRCIELADVVLVCVPTPLSSEGGPDLTAVRSAATTIGSNAKQGVLVVLESTTYPGTTEEIFAPLILGDCWQLGVDCNIAFSPERVDPGNEIFGVTNTPKVVGGLTASCTDRAISFYAQFIEKVIPAKGAKEAEMAKLLENTFRHVNIALVNEMARFSNELNIDLWDAIDCAATKPFGYMPFRPGPGVGGHCIPIDPSYLSYRVKARLGYAFRMVELAEEINRAAPLYVVNRVLECLNNLGRSARGSKVLLLGITYKVDVADCRETPALAIANRLLALGTCVSFHDPFVDEWKIGRTNGESVVELTSTPDPYDAAAEADVTILLQAHSNFDLERLALSAHLIFDTRSALAPAPNVETL